MGMQLTPFISQLIGQTLLPIYAFPVVYLEGGGIEPHRDVTENEISLTMQVQLSPLNSTGGQAWSWPVTVERPRDFHQTPLLSGECGSQRQRGRALSWHRGFALARKQ